MPREEAKEAVRWEAKKLVPQTFEQSVLDFLITREFQERDLKRLEVLWVVADRASILRQLEEFKRFRSRIEAMDVSPLALLNTVRLNYREDLAENLVFVDIGAKKMEINIAKEGTLRFYRSVQTGGDEITLALAQSLGKSYDEAEEFKRRKGFSGPFVGEAEARTPEAVKPLLDRMILEVQRSIDYYRARTAPRFSASVGLALRGAAE
jgi:type IV pilus assembly protein PilM